MKKALVLSMFACFGVGAKCAGKPKMIIDNDWGSTAYITFLQALDAGYEVLGLVGDTANTWALQASLHALALLEVGGLDKCIPVYKGTDYPLINTPELFQLWEAYHGELPWKGVFKRQNDTAEAEGWDPTSGNPDRVIRAAFSEGFPNGTLAGNSSVQWMIEQVRKYPGEVLIYSGGALTNIALAIRTDPEFASLAKGLVIMGGYVDVMLLMTSGDFLQADINSDINFKIDPEATKIALTANFPNITLIGNGANQVFPTREYQASVAEVPSPYSALFQKYTNLEVGLPYWDEIAMFAGLFPEYVTNSTYFYVDVDTAWSSPYYGNIIPKQAIFLPKAQKLQQVKYVYSVNETEFLSQMKHSLQYPKTC